MVRPQLVFAKANDASCELIHNDQYPVRLQQNRLAPKYVDTPETVFHMADKRQPGRTATGIGSRMVVFREDTPDHIFIDIDPKRFVDLLRDP